MASFVGTNIVEDGLIFHYDMANTQKSWKGKPTTNLITDPQFNNSGYWSTWSGRGVSSWSYSTLEGKRVVYTDMSIQNTESHQLFRDIAVPAVLNTYALSIDVLVSSDCTASSVFMNAEYPFGNSFGTNSYDMSKKGTWQRLYAIRDNAYTGNTSNPDVRIRFYFGSTDTGKAGKIYFTNAQLELSTFATPFIDGARSNTQAVLDLAGNNTVTANSLTYNTDGTFQFNTTEALDIGPSSNYFPTGDIAHNLTVEMVAYPTTSDKMLFGQFIDLNRLYIGTYSDNTIRFGFGSLSWHGTYSGGSLRTVSLNKYCHVCLSIINGAARLYVNGLESVYFTDTGVTLPSKLNFGVYYENGAIAPSYLAACKIPLAKLYNRGLSSQEVKSNFEAVRSLYGI